MARLARAALVESAAQTAQTAQTNSSSAAGVASPPAARLLVVTHREGIRDLCEAARPAQQSPRDSPRPHPTRTLTLALAQVRGGGQLEPQDALLLRGALHVPRRRRLVVPRLQGHRRSHRQWVAAQVITAQGAVGAGWGSAVGKRP
jgi:hypothetical protein